MRAFGCLLAISLVVPTTNLFAQQPPIQPGVRLRVSRCHDESTWRGTQRTVCDRTVGVLSTLSHNTIAVADGRDGLVIALDSVTSLEVPGGVRRRTVRGMLIGLAMGAGMGAVTGALKDPHETSGWASPGCFENCPSRARTAVVQAFSYGAIGIVVGAVAGSFMTTVGWEEVALDRLRMSLAPQNDGRLALGMNYSF